jgi:predicted Rossmann-fold nucleotide-binding protein
MTNHRAKAIIAVFGGNDDKAVVFAKRLGVAIAARNQILLTGGKGSETKAVKDSAIAGVGSSPWIGVHRPSSIPVQADCYEKDAGFVIVSDLDHKRNYLEAALCDAAIGLTGREGTYSEVVFALSLNRPVALVGNSWKEKWPVDRQKVPEAAASAAMKKVGTVANDRPLLQKLLNEETTLLGLQSLPADCFRYFDSKDDVKPEDVVDWILGSLKSGNSLDLVGDFPVIDGDERVKNHYREWLADHAA